MNLSDRYIWYWRQNAPDGKQATLFSCLRCAATVGEIDANTIMRELHDAWHVIHDPKP